MMDEGRAANPVRPLSFSPSRRKEAAPPCPTAARRGRGPERCGRTLPAPRGSAPVRTFCAACPGRRAKPTVPPRAGGRAAGLVCVGAGAALRVRMPAVRLQESPRAGRRGPPALPPRARSASHPGMKPGAALVLSLPRPSSHASAIILAPPGRAVGAGGAHAASSSFTGERPAGATTDVFTGDGAADTKHPRIRRRCGDGASGGREKMNRGNRGTDRRAPRRAPVDLTRRRGDAGGSAAAMSSLRLRVSA